MSRARALALREEAGRLANEARQIIDKAGESGLDAETLAKVTKMQDDVEAKVKEAGALERQANLDAGFEEGDDDARGQGGAGGRPPVDGAGAAGGGRPASRFATAEYRNEFNAYMGRGVRGATLQVDADTGGGFIVASEQFVNRLIQALDARLPIREFCTEFLVAYEESLGAPSLDGDVGEFEFGSGELTSAVEDTNLAIGKRELKPRAMKRKLIKISKALLESPKMDVEGLVSQRVAYALAKAISRAIMTGDGAGKPLGLFVASSDGISTGRDIATGNTATDLTGDGLINAQGKLDDGYQSGARWLFHQDQITKLRLLKDGNQQYIWQPGLQAGTASTILAKPYVTNPMVPNTFTTGKYVGMYGDFSHYWLATSLQMAVQRLVELYALTGQVGLLFSKLAMDGMPVLEDAFVRLKLG